MKKFLAEYFKRLVAALLGAMLVLIVAAPVALAVKYSFWWLAAYIVVVPLILALKE